MSCSASSLTTLLARRSSRSMLASCTSARASWKGARTNANSCPIVRGLEGSPSSVGSWVPKRSFASIPHQQQVASWEQTARWSSHAASSAVSKLHSILDDYRRLNFGSTLFSRFIRQMVQATDTNHDGKISFQELQRLLDNIDAKGKMSEAELHEIFNELGTDADGSGEKLIYAEDVESLMVELSGPSVMATGS